MELGWKIRTTAAANKSLVPLSRDEARLDPLLGATIRKIFGSQWYYGQVIAIDADVASGERAYHVAYEDGDEEHLSSVEVKHFLAAAARSARPSEAGRSTRPSAAGTPRPSLAPMPSVRPSRGPARPAPKPSWGRSLGEVKFASVGPALAAVAMGLVMVLGSMCLTCLASSLYRAGDGDVVSELRPDSLGTHLPPWAQAAPPEVAGSSLQRSVEAAALEDVVELAPPKEPRVPIPPERETASEIVTDDVEIFVDVPSQADDTTSALHTSLLNEASYAEHLEPAGGGAEAESVAVQTADDELAAAAAALVEASGLVVRVAGRAFVRMLEEAWHSLLGGVSATLCSAVGVSGSQSTEAEPLGTNDEAGSAGLESLMTSALVACAGVMTILVSIRPAEDVPTPLHTIPRPEASWPGQVTASPMRPFLGKPSPAPHFPSPHALPPTALLHHQATRQSLPACNTPARAKTTLDQVKVEIPSTPAPEHPAAARMSLMSRLGRTPAPAAAVPPGDAIQRRPPPPPPVSLTVEPAPQQMPLRSHAKTTPQPQPAPLSKEDACARCGSALPADDNFCRHCGQQRGKRSCQVPAAMPPSGPVAPAGRAKSKQADKSRFRHTKALSKLKELGYDDSEEVRDVLTKCNGDLNAALREITGPGTRA